MLRCCSLSFPFFSSRSRTQNLRMKTKHPKRLILKVALTTQHSVESKFFSPCLKWLSTFRFFNSRKCNKCLWRNFQRFDFVVLASIDDDDADDDDDDDDDADVWRLAGATNHQSLDWNYFRIQSLKQRNKPPDCECSPKIWVIRAFSNRLLGQHRPSLLL